MEGKLKTVTSQLEQLQAEHARVVSEVTASPSSSGTGVTDDLKSNRLSPVERGGPEEAHGSPEDQTADSQILEHAAIFSSEDPKNPEDKKPQSPEANCRSQHPASEKLITDLEKEVCIRVSTVAF